MILFDTHKAVKELIGVINDIYANEAVTKADLKVTHSDLKQEIHAVARDMEWIKKLLLAVAITVLIAALKYIFS